MSHYDDRRTIGKIVACPGSMVLNTRREPFSPMVPEVKVPLTEYRISVARGCVWGVFIPHGSENIDEDVSQSSMYA